MKKKAVRIQLDLIYKVDADEVDNIYQFDSGFFDAMIKEAHTWNENEEEPRLLIRADLRHNVVNVIDEDLEEDTPLDGIEPA